MKDFFKKIWGALKAFVSSLWGKAVALLLSIPVKYYVYFIIGMVLCAFFSLVFPCAIEWPAFPLSMLAFIICIFRIMLDKKPKWSNALAFALGTLLIQVFCWL